MVRRNSVGRENRRDTRSASHRHEVYFLPRQQHRQGVQEEPAWNSDKGVDTVVNRYDAIRVPGRLCAEPPRCTRQGQRNGTGRSTRRRDARADSLRIPGQSIYGPRNRLFPGQDNRKNKLLKPKVPFTAVYRIVRMTGGNPAPLPTVGETGCASVGSTRLFPIPCFSLWYALPNGRPRTERNPHRHTAPTDMPMYPAIFRPAFLCTFRTNGCRLPAHE